MLTVLTINKFPLRLSFSETQSPHVSLAAVLQGCCEGNRTEPRSEMGGRMREKQNR